MATIFGVGHDKVAPMVTKIRHRGGTKPHLYIEEWAKHLDLSYEIIGGRFDPPVTRQTIYRYAKEQRKIGPDIQTELAHAMGIEPEDLWHHPLRPSADARLKDLSDDDVRRAIQLIETAFPRKASGGKAG